MTRQKHMIISSFFAALLCISSYMVIPIGPVPHSMQPMFVFLTAIILGAKWGCVSILVWFALGALGLPVFAAGKAGLMTFIGPTGGFLLGFLVCVFVVGKGREQISGFKKTVVILTLGMLIIYTLGTVGFKLSMKYVIGKDLDWHTCMSLVVLPFLPFDVVKALMATYLGGKIKNALLHFD